MNDKKHGISSSQLAIFSISSQIGLGVLIMPAILAENIGHDGWISVCISGLISIILICSIVKLLERYSEKNILQINKLLYGKYFGNLVNVLMFIYIFCSTAIGLRLFVEVIQILALKRTPIIITSMLLMIVTSYLTAKGLKAICRYNFYMLIPYLLLVASFWLLRKDLRFTYLMPIGEFRLSGLIESIRHNIFSYAGFELILFIYPYVAKKQKVLRHMVYSGIFTSMFFLIITVVTTALFGERMIATLELPLYAAEQAIIVPVFERLDLFFLILWIPTMESSMRAYFFITYNSILGYFNRDDNNHIFLLVLVSCVIFISRIPKDYEELKLYIDYFEIASLISMCFAVFSYLFSYVNKRGVYKR